MTALPAQRSVVLRRRGFALEAATLAWNVAGVVVLAAIALSSGSVAVVGFGLDSLIEIGAGIVVIWELSGTGAARQVRALRIIAAAFLLLAVYLVASSAFALVTRLHPHDGPAGIVWTGVTAVVMFLLAAGKTATGAELGNPVLVAEGRVTVVDGMLAVVVLIGLAVDALLGWWWADPLAALVLVVYAVREAVHIRRG
ncbi:cation transporter [Amnibacterium sp.]|uniref:cation transporter n=1 Tax=Amnibacterium sp. TaxID=1872496 RepID=UPI002632225D|nr:cation transporter [Amnibacterium sp.]MCU1474132.1 cation transporter [Amnibacterium sp.]